MSKFYNPYQFLPVTGGINGQTDAHRVPFDEIADGRSEAGRTVRHDLWHAQGHSGRIVCSLLLNTPTAIGARQTGGRGNAANLVHQYTWRGEPAMPANSLKGMISSVAEALSQSALRILDNGVISLRVPDREGGGTTRVSLDLTAHDYFRHIDPELVPWNKDREVLTPAEQLFGAVEVNEKGANPDQGRNLAGRLRFHDALPARSPVRRLPETMLRILGSPKLPCPSMYFHLRDHRGGWIGKQDLYEKPHNTDILPNGRKFYLHHPAAQIARADWETRDPDDRKTQQQKLRCAPMAPGQTFFFHIDFDNLSSAELTLLEHALAPGPGFRHRLGLGKPLGLGSVTLSVEAVLLVDRAERYGPNALDVPQQRYRQIWRPAQTALPQERVADFHNRYAPEWDRLSTARSMDKPVALDDESLIDRDTLGVLLALGDPANLVSGLEVHTPLAPGQHGTPEKETFRWFNDNDQRGWQALRPLKPGKKLPPLFTDPREAQRSGLIEQPQVSAVSSRPAPVTPQHAEANAWIDKALERLAGQGGARTEDDVLTRKPMASAVIGIEDAELRQRVFARLCKRCAERNLTFVNKAHNAYVTAELIPNYE